MNPFDIKSFFQQAALRSTQKSLTAGKNKYMPHDGNRKAQRERENKIFAIMPKNLAAEYRRERADIRHTQKGFMGTFWECNTELRMQALHLFVELQNRQET